MHIHSFARLVFYTSLVSSAQARRWCRQETVTCTVTETQTVHTCTTKSTSSSFGTPSYTAGLSSRQTSTSVASSRPTSVSVPSSKQTGTSILSSSQTSNSVPSSKQTGTSVPSSRQSSTSTRTSSTTSLKSSSTSKPTTSSQRSSSTSLTTTHPTVTSSSSSASRSASVSSSASSTASSSTATPSPTGFLIRAASPGQAIANGQYAVVSGEGFLQFNTGNPANGSLFTLSASGQLLYNGNPATINPALPAAAVQFASGSTKLKAKRQSGSAAVTCVVTANTSGNAVLECAADASTIQQACGVGFYLGSTLQCQPLTMMSLPPTSAAATTNPPTNSTLQDPYPGRLFSLQANGPPISATYQGGYAAYFTNTAGITELAFANYFHGATFSLDNNGYLTGVAPCPVGATGCTGSVAYAAVFPIGTTSGPVEMMYGEIPAGYAPIICQVPPGIDAGDGPTYSIRCQDGATGLSNVTQQCASDIFYLGTTLGAGCTATTVLVQYTTSTT